MVNFQPASTDRTSRRSVGCLDNANRRGLIRGDVPLANACDSVGTYANSYHAVIYAARPLRLTLGK